MWYPTRNSVRSNVSQSNAVQSNAVQSNVVHSNVVHSNVVHSLRECNLTRRASQPHWGQPHWGRLSGRIARRPRSAILVVGLTSLLISVLATAVRSPVPSLRTFSLRNRASEEYRR